MFSKQLARPLWRQLTLHRRTRLMIYPSLHSANQVSATLTTDAVSQNGEKENFHVEKSGLLSSKTNYFREHVRNAELKDLEFLCMTSRAFYEAPVILARLNELSKKDKFHVDMLTSNESFKVLTDMLDNEAMEINTPLIIGCLESLLEMTKSDVSPIQSLEHQILWLLARMPIGFVVRVLKIHEYHQETPLRERVFNEALVTLRKRWIEVSNPKDLLTLMYIYKKNDNGYFFKLEEKALELAQQMNQKQLYQIFYLLSVKQHRNMPLIRSLTYHLNKMELTLKPDHLTNLMFACGSLKIYDISLLEKITSALLSSLHEVQSPVTICSLLRSSGMLRWRNPDLLDLLLEFVQNNADQLSARQKATVIITLASLNYVTDKTVNLVKTLMSGDISSLCAEDSQLWLDMVWSLTVLRLLDKETAESVLDKQFTKKVQVGSDFKIQLSSIKLLNINTAANLEVPGYSGSSVTSDKLINGSQILPRSERQLAASVKEALTTFAPIDKFVKTDIVTLSGYFIDAELFVDSQGEIKPYHESIDSPDRTRVCIKVLDYHDLTLSTVVPTGLQSMSTRHLQALGYKVIEIPYFELINNRTTVKIAHYLQSRLKQTVGKTSQGR